MPLDTGIPPNDILSALIGEFVEQRKDVSPGHFGVIGAIRAITKEKLELLTHKSTSGKRKEELKNIINEAWEIEKEISLATRSYVEKESWIGFVRWWVGNGDKWENPFFQKVFRLYEIRYGQSETKKLMEIFRNPENNGRFFLYAEFGKAYTNAPVSIRKIFLFDMQVDKKEELDAWKESGYLEPFA